MDAGDTTLDKVKSAIADGLEIPVSSEHEWIIDFQPLIQQLGMTKVAYGFPSEELTTFTFGHFGVVPKIPDSTQVNLGAVDWVGKTPGEIFDTVNALPEKPVLIINHPIGTTFMGYFTAAQFDNAQGKGTDPALWSDHFEAIEVWNGSDFDTNKQDSVAAWFSLLNTGKTVWGLGNSDSHHIRSNPVGYPRNCLQFGHDDPTMLSANIVRDQLRAGAFNVSGGLYMTAVGPDGKGPGQTSTAGVLQSERAGAELAHGEHARSVSGRRARADVAPHRNTRREWQHGARLSIQCHDSRERRGGSPLRRLSRQRNDGPRAAPTGS